MPEVTFLPSGVTYDLPAGASLLEGARRAGIFVETPCGGVGTCKKCLVKISGSGGEADALICQARVGDAPLVVTLPETDGGEGRFENFSDPSRYLPRRGEPFLQKIYLDVAPPAPLDGLSDADRLTRAFKKKTGAQSVELPLPLLRTLPDNLREDPRNESINFNGTRNDLFGNETRNDLIGGETRNDLTESKTHNDLFGGGTRVDYYIENNTAKVVSLSRGATYGAAVDIGTTTVALWLVDMDDGRVVSSRCDYNSQIEFGPDIISRIVAAKKNLPELRERILSTINGLINSACGYAGIIPNEIRCVSAAGNTTMVHLLLGVNPEYIRLAPYTPAVFSPHVYSAGQVGIGVNENAPVLLAPAVGSYVGGDVTAGLLCTSLAQNSNELILYIDIGTNGEIVLGSGEFIFACACSAGPAFEGGGIKHGSRARTGAIERVAFNEDGAPEVFTIGGAPPVGICGSGIISAVAGMYKTKIIDPAGRFPVRNSRYPLGGGIEIYETDVDNFIRAKGAIFSACRTLIENVGLTFGDIERVYVAGGFGRYLDLDDARTVGLLPRLPDEKFIFLGNSSVTGAYLSLVSEERRAVMRGLADKITYVDLSGEPGYMERYTAALFLPHTDRALFE